MNIVESVKDKAETLGTFIGDLNKIAIDKIEKSVKSNTASVDYLSDIYIKQLRAISEIRDAESIKDFAADTISRSGDLIKRIFDDGKTRLNLMLDFTKEAGDLLKKDSIGASKKMVGKPATA